MAFEVTHFGANIHHWQIDGNDIPILFVSSGSQIQKGIALRGGVPICFPWFGPKEGGLQHGFARIMEWNFVEEDENFSHLSLSSNAETKSMWPFDFKLDLKIKEVENRLSISIDVHNTDLKPFDITFAFHTYFLISDIATIKIKGLQGVDFIDKTDNFEVYEADEDLVTIEEKTDRIYLTNNPVSIIDEGYSREIKVSHEGNSSLVMWNPWTDGNKIKDLGEEQYRDFICIETAIAPDAQLIEAGESYTITQSIEVVNL
jgi:glucose-6-phosphate 1-epimerase